MTVSDANHNAEPEVLHLYEASQVWGASYLLLGIDPVCHHSVMPLTDSICSWGRRLIPVAVVLIAACGSTPPATRPSTPEPTHQRGEVLPPSTVTSRLSPQQATDVTIYAIGLVGTPYRFGGNTPESGFDCSGLIGHVYQTRAAVITPRTVSRLQNWGQSVPVNEVRSGDLVIFAQRGVVNHAGIYVGENRFVHAPSTGGTVRLDSLNSKYWAQQKVAYRRP